MIAEKRMEIIKNRLKKAFSPSHLEVIDESNLHKGHAGYQGGGRHFSVTISAGCFNGLTRIEAHRQIYGLFTDMMPNEIHALRITIL